ncbi:MAG: membrane protein insertion efficiency factor YidD [Candidatus Nealsonbacteria bacterium CG_4_8_14_3_um_filter_39_7]|uniref:Putative membrane protein insertion efficiency factor n=1 Tax=Candidatus Nealsonbacteria bacterium CG23_combo_of_CG06-09_8_20_14_all_39_17 TaxID=1974722 RepID=A0A2G9YTQ4_9BACT|nr:MAG: membrane protein insertion efficiency factor YidD [Candidatus Nealsonbacteria bacterium CG23_combo_of_CG06-09_8_20_14_all_39_17]PIU44234.1 MAG: membrane protein insertion efficiency factor YidD [Candidatus Nealsonbacteria bacterium CG07_land_8_20_14_0_80_39_13]PIW91114.1 MAG: membrane protein insertion efficiency factor YidD [Candidatus Nealsonbacteria bacterium CG_4_8_14_3_um_filter_39_7]
MKKIIIKILRFYQKVLSPDQGIFSFLFRKSCRFYPTCSEYACLAVEKRGVIKGIWLGMKRISRCHPWREGGVDMP